jgi:hypothetical protein
MPSPVQALAAEWRKSLEQSHTPGTALDTVLQKHDAEVTLCVCACVCVCVA